MSETQPRAQEYLNDLARMLEGHDPANRAEVLQSVREHIDGAVADLGHAPSAAEMDAILTDLGTPGDVAAQAWEGDVGPASQAGISQAGLAYGAPTGRQPPTTTAPAPLTGAWVPPVATLLILVGAFFGLLVVPLVLLLGGIVLLTASPLWRPWQKVLGAVGAPLLVLPFQLAGLLAWQMVSGVEVWAVLLPVAAVIGAGLLIWLWVVGARESTRMRSAII